MKIRLLLSVITLLVLAGCSLVSSEEGISTEVTTPDLPTATLATQESTPAPIDETPTPGPITLTIWIPDVLDPKNNTQAGQILQDQLDEFNLRNPGVNVEIRIKAADGPGGLVDSLSTATTAAPLALPNLVALPYEAMQLSVRRGLLHPYDGLSTVMTDDDWYIYAQELAYFQNGIYGLPFAGDLQILAYRPEIIPEPPEDWATALSSGLPYAFPAADPRAIFTMTEYQANGGISQDEEGNPILIQDPLSEVLTFFQQAEEVNVMPFWLTQFQTDTQVWEAFEDARADMIVTWITQYLDYSDPNVAITSVITPDGADLTLADGWVWALPTGNSEHHDISVDLAEFLVQSDFLSEWSEALGYLPPRPTAMRHWSNIQIKYQLDRISTSAHLIPPSDILESIGPALEQATVNVLKKQSDPLSASQTAVDSQSGP